MADNHPHHHIPSTEVEDNSPTSSTFTSNAPEPVEQQQREDAARRPRPQQSEYETADDYHDTRDRTRRRHRRRDHRANSRASQSPPQDSRSNGRMQHASKATKTLLKRKGKEMEETEEIEQMHAKAMANGCRCKVCKFPFRPSNEDQGDDEDEMDGGGKGIAEGLVT